MQWTPSNGVISCKPCKKRIHDERHTVGTLPRVHAFSSFLFVIHDNRGNVNDQRPLYFRIHGFWVGRDSHEEEKEDRE